MATGLGRRNRGQGVFALTPYFGRFVNPIPIRGTDYGHIINTCPRPPTFRPSAGSTGKADIFQGRPHFLSQLFFWHLLLFQCRHKKKLRKKIQGQEILKYSENSCKWWDRSIPVYGPIAKKCQLFWQNLRYGNRSATLKPNLVVGFIYVLLTEILCPSQILHIRYV